MQRIWEAAPLSVTGSSEYLFGISRGIPLLLRVTSSVVLNDGSCLEGDFLTTFGFLLLCLFSIGVKFSCLLFFV